MAGADIATNWSGPAFTSGGEFVPGSTLTLTVSPSVRSESLTVTRRTYTPVELKVADAVTSPPLTLPLTGVKLTAPGPLASDQANVLPPSPGNASSKNAASSNAGAGRTTSRSGPVMTNGASFVGATTVTVTSSEADARPSLAISRST